MNKRIEEFYSQVGLDFENFQRVTVKKGDMEKFAELIVDQMLAITDAHTEVFQTDRDRALIEHIKKSVKQHFGVRE